MTILLLSSVDDDRRMEERLIGTEFGRGLEGTEGMGGARRRWNERRKICLMQNFFFFLLKIIN